MAKLTLALIGAGKLGTSLALALHQKGYQIIAVADVNEGAAREAAQALGAPLATADPDAAGKEADLVILAVPDSAVKTVAENLAAKQAFKKGQIVCHTSGFLPSGILVSLKLFGVFTLSLHPFVSIARKMQAGSLAGAYFALEGDAVAVEQAREMVAALDGFSITIKPQDKALYHAAGAMASYLAVALWLGAKQALIKAGADEESAGQMMAGMVHSLEGNIKLNGLTGSLTGPVMRGDLATVQGHLQALKNWGGPYEQIYRMLGQDVLEKAKEQGLSAELTQKLSAVLEGKN
ncbi:prephenate dehydrogenase/arogenate dehydrogenase family protein [candidate division TA06 bacterium]|nr:prephenate dehydrogenase/arogenate dehydrogenase family protein [candidate division TA06 bacterium]